METKYMIARSIDLDALAQAAQQKINEGWMPQGGVALANSSSLIFTQALILKSS